MTWLTEDRSRTYLICLWRPVDLSFSKTFVDRFFRIFHSILRGTSLYNNMFSNQKYADSRDGGQSRVRGLRNSESECPKLTKSSSSVFIISSSVFDSDIFLKNVSVFFLVFFISCSLFIWILVLNFFLCEIIFLMQGRSAGLRVRVWSRGFGKLWPLTRYSFLHCFWVKN